MFNAKFMNSNIKFEPLSDCTDLGSPTKVKSFTSALTIVLVVICLSVMASGKRVAARLIVKRY